MSDGARKCEHNLILSRTVPEHIYVEHYRWCKQMFFAMSSKFRECRRAVNRPCDTCHWCGHTFADGEMMALADKVGAGNVVLCQACASELLSSGVGRVVKIGGEE